VGHHAVQEMMEILVYRKVCSRWFLRLLYRQFKRTAGNCPTIHPTVRFCSLRLPLVGPLKDHLGGDHYETDEAVQEAVWSWLRGAGKDF
jgi:hypothetical protein